MTDPVEQYFDDTIEGVKNVAFDAVTINNIDIQAMGTNMPAHKLLSGAGEDMVKDAVRGEVDTLVDGIGEQQKAIVLDCSDQMTDGSIDEAAYAEYQQAFVDGLSHWIDHLNPEAAEHAYACVEDSFDDIVEHTTHYRSVNGDTFADRIYNADEPRHVAEERLNDLTAYVDRVATLLDDCDDVYVTKEFDIGVSLLSKTVDVQFDVQHEGQNVVGEVQQYLDEQVEGLLDEAYE